MSRNPPVASAEADRAPSDRESRRIIREDLLTNLLVEAGAGSGKTQMLAERMAAGVAAGVYPIEHMAAVTFTRKAASELRGRFQHALEARLKADSGKGDWHPQGSRVPVPFSAETVSLKGDWHPEPSRVPVPLTVPDSVAGKGDWHP